MGMTSVIKEIQSVKTVWVVASNTDLTEGRGHQLVKHVCETQATAIRMGRRGYVMGSDCPVHKATAVKVDNTWLIPGEICSPTKEDIEHQIRFDDKESMLARMKEAGFTDVDIKKLRV